MFAALLFVTLAGIFTIALLVSLVALIRRRQKYQPLDMKPERKFWYILASKDK